nr:MAG TPA: hypothetical protein [Caudoviricetes sp.]
MRAHAIYPLCHIHTTDIRTLFPLSPYSPPFPPLPRGRRLQR